MKKLGKVIRSLIIVLLAGSVIIAGCFAGVFYVSRAKPDDIYLFGYALIICRDDGGRPQAWFVHRTKCENLRNGDSVVYYDGGYLSADAMKADPMTFYSDPADEYSTVEVNDENIVGEVIAVWQQK